MATPEQSTETQNQAPEQSTETQNQAHEEQPTGAASQEAQDPEGITFFDDDDDKGGETPEGESNVEETGGEETAASGTKVVSQEKFEKKVNRLVFEKHEERRKREEIEATHKATLEELRKLKGEEAEIVIPEMPDVYDPEYDRKIKERDNALREQAKATAARELAERNQREAAERQQQELEKKYREQADAMYEAAVKAGIKKEDIQQAETTLVSFIKDPALAQFILAHKDSALIVNHLANNMGELEKVCSMPGVNASAYIVTDVLPLATQFKPATPSTPSPLEIPSGRAAGNKNPYLEGVTFE